MRDERNKTSPSHFRRTSDHDRSLPNVNVNERRKDEKNQYNRDATRYKELTSEQRRNELSERNRRDDRSRDYHRRQDSRDERHEVNNRLEAKGSNDRNNRNPPYRKETSRNNEQFDYREKLNESKINLDYRDILNDKKRDKSSPKNDDNYNQSISSENFTRPQKNYRTAKRR